MTEWKTVCGSQLIRPAEWDIESSSATVYQRRNIQRVTIDDTELWQYEERQMTRDEYAVIRDERYDQLRADVDFLFAMTDIDL